MRLITSVPLVCIGLASFAPRAEAQGLPEVGWYCVVPVVRSLTIADSHERQSRFGGTTAYLYFSTAGDPKSGTVPSHIGNMWFDWSEAWATNVRGASQVSGETSRTQWEFHSGGAAQTSDVVYPIYLPEIGFSTNCLENRFGWDNNLGIPVREDDEWLTLLDDDVGTMWFLTSHCNDEVFSQGHRQGWTSLYSTSGWDDIVSTTYQVWCYAPSAGGQLGAYPSAIAGDWWREFGPAYVQENEFGEVVAVINEYSDQQAAASDGWTISVPAWGITGELNYTLGGPAVLWSNGTVWTRAPYINGAWRGDGEWCGVFSDGYGNVVGVMNELDDYQDAYLDGDTIHVPGWDNLTGYVTTTQITWANSTIWTR